MGKGNAVIALAAERAPALLQRYRPALEKWYGGEAERQIIPLEDIPSVRQQIVASLQPAPREEIAKAVTVLFGSFKAGNVIEDATIYSKAMIAELTYPADVLDEAISYMRRTEDWLPSIAQMVKLCDRLMEKRRMALQALLSMERTQQWRGCWPR